MKECLKKFVILSVVLFLACSYVWALPGVTKKTAEKPVAVVEETVPVVQEVPALTSENSLASSETEQTVTSLNYEELLKVLEKSKVILGGNSLDAVKKAVETVALDIQLQNELITQQNNQIADLKKELNKTVKTKLFADLGVALGFKGENFRLGATADFGLRFGKGLMTKVGAQYMMMDFGKAGVKFFEGSPMDNLSLTATVGWEW